MATVLSQMPSVMSIDNSYCSSPDVLMDIYLQWLLFFVNVVKNVSDNGYVSDVCSL